MLLSARALLASAVVRTLCSTLPAWGEKQSDRQGSKQASTEAKTLWQMRGRIQNMDEHVHEGGQTSRQAGRQAGRQGWDGMGWDGMGWDGIFHSPCSLPSPTAAPVLDAAGLCGVHAPGLEGPPGMRARKQRSKHGRNMKSWLRREWGAMLQHGMGCMRTGWGGVGWDARYPSLFGFRI